MADYFTDFAFEIEFDDERGAKGTMELLERIGKAVDEGFWPEDIRHMESDWVDHGIEGERDGTKVHVTTQEGHPNIDLTLEFVKEALKRFKPKGVVSFEWACHCTRSLPDGFGGGAAFVTANEIKTIGTYDSIVQMRKEHEATASNSS